MAAMICKMCGATMNHHGEKLVYVETREVLTEQMVEAHTCPHCGFNDTRMAE